MRANYHTHSTFCDGSASLEAMAEAAHKAGYASLGFSSHAPFPSGEVWGTMKAGRLGEYGRAVRALRGTWEGRGLEIYTGLEVDYYPPEVSPAHTRFDEAELDYRIGSVHSVVLDGTPPFTVDCDVASLDASLAAVGSTLAGGTREAGLAMCRDYYRRLGAMIVEGGFDILGHIDLVRKNNAGNRLFDEEGREYLDLALGTADLLRGRDFVVEVNLGAMARRKRDEPYPALGLLRAMRQWGVRITFSADAHDPSHLGMYLEVARALAEAAGYRSVAVLTRDGPGGSPRWTETGLDET